MNYCSRMLQIKGYIHAGVRNRRGAD